MLKFVNPYFFQNHFLSNLQDTLNFKISKILGEIKKFFKGSKVTRSSPKVKILPPNIRPSLKSNFFYIFKFFINFFFLIIKKYLLLLFFKSN